MIRTNRTILTLLLALALIFTANGLMASEKSGLNPQRIISMSPATTEILFALGQGSKVVGVTRYGDYPEAATTIARVGGFMDPNYEEIVALKPDLVILLTSHRDVKDELEKMHIRTLATPHETIADIHQAIPGSSEMPAWPTKGQRPC